MLWSGTLISILLIGNWKVDSQKTKLSCATDPIDKAYVVAVSSFDDEECLQPTTSPHLLSTRDT